MTIHSSATAQENAMTEIALALAMGFFSLMVLTLISMGAGETTPVVKSQTLVLAPLAQNNAGGATNVASDDLIIIFDGDGFLDVTMNRINPKDLINAMPNPATRVVLALDPGLPLQRAMKARGQIDTENLVVSSLDKNWLKALADKRRRQ